MNNEENQSVSPLSSIEPINVQAPVVPTLTPTPLNTGVLEVAGPAPQSPKKPMLSKTTMIIAGVAVVSALIGGGGVYVLTKNNDTASKASTSPTASVKASASPSVSVTPVATPSIESVQARARDVDRKSDMRAIQGKLAEYYAINAKYPTSLNEKALGLPVDACKVGASAATCAAPEYSYKAFIKGTKIPAATHVAASAAQADATSKDAENYILYSNKMETQPAGTSNGLGTFWMVTSN
jgi:hypothetical protein